ncbi:hypothetical protein J2W28_001048 [Variovorax boronicumulans]|uniref:hypothetical protein n=1 Tax=Variovorax boronicumulans TaxID=436515 RepID=UPI002786C1DA|nr:hypothetical protein [Variovorax boronicumulans]MDP9992020.1 hypothetical protein [Variovorax boronicumulans]MDQ0001915.1 hypothetical protein [Variovorax boronicumulans]
MDFTVIPIEKVKAAFARALALNPDREAAARAAAQALGIPVETVREALAINSDAATPAVLKPLIDWQVDDVRMMYQSPPCAAFSRPLRERSEFDA